MIKSVAALPDGVKLDKNGEDLTNDKNKKPNKISKFLSIKILFYYIILTRKIRMIKIKVEKEIEVIS